MALKKTHIIYIQKPENPSFLLFAVGTYVALLRDVGLTSLKDQNFQESKTSVSK